MTKFKLKKGVNPNKESRAEKLKKELGKLLRLEYVSMTNNTDCAICSNILPSWARQYKFHHTANKNFDHESFNPDKPRPEFDSIRHKKHIKYGKCPSCNREAWLVWLYAEEPELEKVPDWWREIIKGGTDKILEFGPPIIPRAGFDEKAWREKIEKLHAFYTEQNKKEKCKTQPKSKPKSTVSPRRKTPKKVDAATALMNAKPIKRKMKT